MSSQHRNTKTSLCIGVGNPLRQYFNTIFLRRTMSSSFACMRQMKQTSFILREPQWAQRPLQKKTAPMVTSERWWLQIGEQQPLQSGREMEEKRITMGMMEGDKSQATQQTLQQQWRWSRAAAFPLPGSKFLIAMDASFTLLLRYFRSG